MACWYVNVCGAKTIAGVWWPCVFYSSFKALQPSIPTSQQQVPALVRVKGVSSFELGWSKNLASVELWEISDCRSMYFINLWVYLNQITQVIAAHFTYSFTILITMQVSYIRTDIHLGKREKGISGFLPCSDNTHKPKSHTATPKSRECIQLLSVLVGTRVNKTDVHFISVHFVLLRPKILKRNWECCLAFPQNW